MHRRHHGHGGGFRSGGYGPGGYWPGQGPIYLQATDVCVYDQRTGQTTCPIPTSSLTPSSPIVIGPSTAPIIIGGRHGARLSLPFSGPTGGAMGAWHGPRRGLGGIQVPGFPGVPQDLRPGIHGTPMGGSAPIGGFMGGLQAAVPRSPRMPVLQTSGPALSYGDSSGMYGDAISEETITNLQTASEANPALTETVSALLPAVSSLIETTQDPYRKAELLKVKLSHQMPGSISYQKTQAKLKAAQARLGIKDEAIQSTREWRTLGKAGMVTGIGIGAAIIFLILTKALK